MTTPVDPFAELEARRAEQIAEYGTYAATEQIWSGSSLAYDIGHPIPASNVDPSDLSVVTQRHYCPPQLPGQPACPTENNLVLARTGPGAAVRVDQPAEEKPVPAEESKPAPAKATAVKKES